MKLHYSIAEYFEILFEKLDALAPSEDGDIRSVGANANYGWMDAKAAAQHMRMPYRTLKRNWIDTGILESKEGGKKGVYLVHVPYPNQKRGVTPEQMDELRGFKFNV